MTDNNTFERFVADHLADDGSGLAQADRLAALIDQRTGEQRQWPRWLALIKEPPMRTNSHLAVGSPTVRVAAILFATLLLAVSLAAVGVTGARLIAADGPIVVDTSGEGTVATIGEAVAMAEDGDEILVRPGTYVEAVVIEADITLRGDGPVEQIVIMAPDDGPKWDTRFPWLRERPYAIVLAGSNGTVSGLTLRGEDSRLFTDGGAATVTGMLFDEVGTPPVGPGTPIARALVVTGGASAHVHDNDFRGGNGINVFDYSVARIEENRLVVGGIYGDFGDGTSIVGNTFSGTAPMAIRFGEPADVLVEGNEISGRESGINTVNGMGSAVVKGNTISGTTTAAISADRSTGQILDNVLADNVIGISWSGDGGTVAGNTVTGGATGIIVGAGASVVQGNTVEGAQNAGMRIYGTATPELSGNKLCGNEVNLDIVEGAEVVDDGTNEVCEDA